MNYELFIRPQPKVPAPLKRSDPPTVSRVLFFAYFKQIPVIILDEGQGFISL